MQGCRHQGVPPSTPQEVASICTSTQDTRTQCSVGNMPCRNVSPTKIESHKMHTTRAIGQAVAYIPSKEVTVNLHHENSPSVSNIHPGKGTTDEQNLSPGDGMSSGDSARIQGGLHCVQQVVIDKKRIGLDTDCADCCPVSVFQGLGQLCIEKSITDTDLGKRLRLRIAVLSGSCAADVCVEATNELCINVEGFERLRCSDHGWAYDTADARLKLKKCMLVVYVPASVC